MRTQSSGAALWILLAGPIALIGWQRPVSALTIDPVAQLRTVRAEASAAEPSGPLQTDSSALGAPDFGLFDESVSADIALSVASAHATASQRSEIGLLSVTGVGAADATAAGSYVANSNGSSRFSFTFDLSEASPYELAALLLQDITCGCPGINVQTSAHVRLIDVTNSQTLASGFVDDSTGAFASVDASGVLPAGRYRLDADSQAAGDWLEGGTGASFDFTFTVIPEPTTALLLGAGLAALAAWRKRSPGSGPF